MALISFKEWRQKIDESSPMTRLRAGIMQGKGNYPMTASVMSHSTPHPEMVKKAEKELGTSKKKKKKKKD